MSLLRRKGMDPGDAARRSSRGSGSSSADLLVLIGAYVVAFIAQNNKSVTVHFVLVSAKTSVIWLILLSLAIGLIGGLLLSQLERRRGRKQRG